MKALNISKLSEDAKWLDLLVYGGPGAGKTWFCGSAALHESTAPLLYLEINANPQSLAGMNPALPHDQFFAIQVTDYAELNHTLTWLLRGAGSHKAIGDALEANGLPRDWFPKTLAIDSVTELQRLEVLRLGGNDHARLMQSVSAQMDLGRPRIQDWGTILNEFVLFGRSHYQLPMHVIMTCLEMTQHEDGDEDKPLIGLPAMQGQSAQLFPSTALSVMHLVQKPMGTRAKVGDKVVPVYNEGYLRQHKHWFARDNTGLLPAVLPNPSAPLLVNIIHNKLRERGVEV